jgi:GrpB-like predicted nucleotidyltransferase (UPF0157 family)
MLKAFQAWNLHAKKAFFIKDFIDLLQKHPRFEGRYIRTNRHMHQKEAETMKN